MEVLDPAREEGEEARRDPDHFFGEQNVDKRNPAKPYDDLFQDAAKKYHAERTALFSS